ncbi:hypothetical protein OsJ_16375 [Oryza sativa Japonica Group]|uniref:Uncharacterized protein n=1 Tax=Oryza sativa subsp. japonica TaxID=39947 RepID=A3AXY1_ORYSJ|nr:hypothetical protein OsJ_16375 [Oryza sativa Japonica Group]
MASSLRCRPTRGAAFRRPVGTRGADRFSAGVLRCSKRGNGVVGLKLSCAAASASPASQALPPLPWWAKELKEEDEKFFPLVDLDPAGQGQEEIDAIWNALLSGPLQPVLRALREIGAAGNLFRCRSFHIGILSVLIFILSFKDNSSSQGIYGILSELIWFINVQLYFSMVYSEVTGLKHMRLFWLGVYRLLQTKAIGDTALPLPCGGDSGDFVPSGGDSGVFVPRGGDSGVFVPRGGDSGVFVIPASSSGCLPSLLASPVVTRRSHTRARRPKSDGTNSPLPDGDDTLADDAISTLPDTEATSSAPATPQIPDSNAAASTLFERFVYISTGGSSMSGTGTSTLFLFLHVVSALLITAVKNPSIRKKVADQVGHRVRLSPSVLSVFVFSSAAIAFTYDAIKSGKELEGLGSYLLKITKTGKYSGCHQNIDKKQELNKETP